MLGLNGWIRDSLRRLLQCFDPDFVAGPGAARKTLEMGLAGSWGDCRSTASTRTRRRSGNTRTLRPSPAARSRAMRRGRFGCAWPPRAPTASRARGAIRRRIWCAEGGELRRFGARFWRAAPRSLGEVSRPGSRQVSARLRASRLGRQKTKQLIAWRDKTAGWSWKLIDPPRRACRSCSSGSSTRTNWPGCWSHQSRRRRPSRRSRSAAPGRRAGA
jgi:hypothetical protein